jgi:TonB family protein
MRRLIPVVLCSIAASSLIAMPMVKAAPAASKQVKVEDSDPEKVFGERPTYPEEARQAGIEGKLTAWLHVDAKGSVTKVEIKESPGPQFSEEAIAKFSRWKFKPEVKKGQPIAFIGEYTIIFRLKDGQPFVSNS